MEAANAERVPGYVAEVADELLELKDNPRVIAQYPIGVYLRQYSGNIDSAFGRDVDGYIWPQGANRRLKSAVDGDDWNAVNQTMLDDGYDYLVASTVSDDGSLMLVDRAGDYGIYRATGSPTVIKERNTLGQVIKVTNVDSNENPENRNGYTTAEYTYDEDGRVKDEIRKNVSVNSASDNEYLAAGVRQAYHNMHLIYEAFYDDEGKLVEQPAGHVAIEQKWDDNQVISRTYLDENGNPKSRIDGYS